LNAVLKRTTYPRHGIAFFCRFLVLQNIKGHFVSSSQTSSPTVLSTRSDISSNTYQKIVTAMGCSESKEEGVCLENASIARATFPTEFNLYYESLSNGMKLVLGEHKDQPSHVFSLPSGWYGDMVLYSSPNPKSDPLAVVRDAGKVGQHDAIETAAVKPGMGTIQEQLEYFSRGWMVGYSFACPVGTEAHREHFEWRSSKSSEVKDLGESSQGWELVRLDNKGEVVAVWSETKLKMAMSKTASFRFVGSSVGGHMGTAFTVMAVTTFLRIWQRRMQIYMRGGIAAGASSSAAAVTVA
jgi:hypothetical protein